MKYYVAFTLDSKGVCEYTDAYLTKRKALNFLNKNRSSLLSAGATVQIIEHYRFDPESLTGLKEDGYSYPKPCRL